MNAWVASIVFAQHVRGVGNGEFGSDCFSDTDGVCDHKQMGIGALEPGRARGSLHADKELPARSARIPQLRNQIFRIHVAGLQHDPPEPSQSKARHIGCKLMPCASRLPLFFQKIFF